MCLRNEVHTSNSSTAYIAAYIAAHLGAYKIVQYSPWKETMTGYDSYASQLLLSVPAVYISLPRFSLFLSG